MTYNYGYAVQLGKELQRQRMQEAERERLIRSVTTANPPMLKKLWFILRSRWETARRRESISDIYASVSPLPKKSQSI